MLVLLTYKIENKPTIPKEQQLPCTDLKQIIQRDRLDIALEYNSLNYYILHGSAYGFQYELAKHFADHLGVDLRVNTINDIKDCIERLKKGEYDIVSTDLTIINNRFGRDVVLTQPYAYVNKVLVQNKENKKINHITELHNQTIFISKGSIFKQIIASINLKYNINIHVVEVSNINAELLIDAVAENKIKYTISDYHLANFNSKIYKNLDVSLEITPKLPLGWAMRSCSKNLLDTFNIWFSSFKKENDFKHLHHRYFQRPRIADKRKGDFFSVRGGKISEYDEVVKKYSKKYNLDWRLISALMFEESRFQHELVSPTGAFGIMQFMPTTAENFNINMETPVYDHIRAGIKYLHQINKRFLNEVPDSAQRIKFVLASYNVGEGHIIDAIALAKKHNKNPQIWNNNVEKYLILKSNKQYYNDEVVKFGFCKGIRAVRFVENILERYEHYRNAFPPQKK